MTVPAQRGACAVPEASQGVPVVEFRILGALNLLGADGRELTSVPAQPKRVALLAYPAAATPHRLHRRDSLVALFWPELDQEHARAALRQALHGLRRALGEGVVVSRGDEDIGLDADQIRCDVVEFERAVDAGRPADALDLYRGDLLEGFFIRGSPEFEQWLEDERVRLKVMALRSATLLAERGGLAESAQWGRRALRIAPLDEPTLRRLMQSLDRLGDRAGALDAYEGFAKRLAVELEADPAPETRALAGAVRERVATLSSNATELAPLQTAAEPPEAAGVPHPRRRWLGVAAAAFGLAVALPCRGLGPGGVGLHVPPRPPDRVRRADHRRGERENPAHPRAGAGRSAGTAPGARDPAGTHHGRARRSGGLAARRLGVNRRPAPALRRVHRVQHRRRDPLSRKGRTRRIAVLPTRRRPGLDVRVTPHLGGLGSLGDRARSV